MKSPTQAFEKLALIGRGAYGVVHKARHLKTNKLVAIKDLDLEIDLEEINDIRREIALLSQLQGNSNIIRYFGSHLNETHLWIVMEFAENGSVRDLLTYHKTLEEKWVSIITREVLVGLRYMHGQGIIHRDVKAANILLSKEGHVKLCDFGIARTGTSVNQRYSTVGTPYWMAPEVIDESSVYDYKVKTLIRGRYMVSRNNHIRIDCWKPSLC